MSVGTGDLGCGGQEVQQRTVSRYPWQPGAPYPSSRASPLTLGPHQFEALRAMGPYGAKVVKW